VTQPVYLPDTHTLYWHITRPSRLSSTARNITDDAASGKAVLVASTIVLAELYWVLRKQGADDLVSCRSSPPVGQSPTYGFQPVGAWPHADRQAKRLRAACLPVNARVHRIGLTMLRTRCLILPRLDLRLGFGLGVLDLRALRGPYQTSGEQKCSPDLLFGGPIWSSDYESSLTSGTSN
jgi:predicted nucleic acid-binding protein